MPRPKSDKAKESVISLRTYAEVREAVEEYARAEHRTVAQMADLLLREAIIARRRQAKEQHGEIDNLP